MQAPKLVILLLAILLMQSSGIGQRVPEPGIKRVQVPYSSIKPPSDRIYENSSRGNGVIERCSPPWSIDGPVRRCTSQPFLAIFVHQKLRRRVGTRSSRILTASRPFITGIEKSKTTKSGCRRVTASIASHPLSASPQILKSPSCSNISQSACRTNALSSTINTILRMTATSTRNDLWPRRRGGFQDFNLALLSISVGSVTYLKMQE
jgi:hypothetical protein